MIIGIDFDNTIVCYDRMFYDLALEKGMISSDVTKDKNSVRDALKKVGKEDLFTELQGIVYGPRILDAKPFSGIVDFLVYCKENNIVVYIISHKTKHPFIGEKHNLHEYALSWLEKNIYDAPERKTGISRENIFLETSKNDKCERIKSMKCDYFIDDLPEFLSEKNFPSNVKRILFDPDNKLLDSVSYTRVLSWGNIIDLFKRLKEDESNLKTMIIIENFLKKDNLMSEKKELKLTRLSGGKNNKVFRLDIYDVNSEVNKNKFLLKKYFKHQKDTRDRLNAESSFIKYISTYDLGNVPKLYFLDVDNNFGLYGFIEGKKITSEDINEKIVSETVDFLIKINTKRDSFEAKKISDASEACFSIDEHIGLVTKRIIRLKKISESSEINRQAISFVEGVLIPRWENVLSNLNADMQAYYQKYAVHSDSKISTDEQILSPSDFGYHNVLFDNNKLYFLDFEYAGWDDPAKLLCDFFCSPSVPVPDKYFENFSKKMLVGIYSDKELSEKAFLRAKLLLSLHRIKWCCIMLNEFLPTDNERRAFASTSEFDNDAEKRKQLKKVKDYLNSWGI